MPRPRALSRTSRAGSPCANTSCAPSNYATGVLRFAISINGPSPTYEQTIDGQAALPTGTWEHVAVVLGSSGGIMYLNGVQVGAKSTLTLRPADLGNLQNYYIGRSQFAVDPYLDGDIDEFRVYDRALAPSEIQTLANGEELSKNWTVLQQPSQGLGRRWGEVREFTSRTRGGQRPGQRPSFQKSSRRVHLWTRLE